LKTHGSWHFGTPPLLPTSASKTDRDHGPLEEAASFHQAALIPPGAGDGERLKTLLPQSEIEYHETNAEHSKQQQTAAHAAK